ncbi:MAG: 16S rRNA (guanine(527)-N(7))-methyltransferase RsmG [Planctomycetota bacterium]|nr:MAG: 16S rRNA (guanine(527)-N(7))-methyltransferase RsmG [Planctomycetota bacterium]
MTTSDTSNNEYNTFDAAFFAACSAIGLHNISKSHIERMWSHFCRVVEVNRQFNLTRITSPADAAVKHYADSLTLLAAPWISTDQRLTVLDVGTGAGFPAVPLAIMCKEWRITAIDGTAKKVRFVAETAELLGLDNLRTLHARAADLAGEQPESFDLVLMRAVTKLAEGLKEVNSLIAPGGAVVFYKTSTITDGELADGRKMAQKLGLQETSPVRITLPSTEGPIERLLIRCQRSRSS